MVSGISAFRLVKLPQQLKRFPPAHCRIHFDRMPAALMASPLVDLALDVSGESGGQEDLKGIVAVMASNASNFMTAAIIPVDGGTVAW